MTTIFDRAQAKSALYLLATAGGQQFICGSIVDHGEWVELLDASAAVGDRQTIAQHLVAGPLADGVYIVRAAGITVRRDAIAWIAAGEPTE